MDLARVAVPASGAVTIIANTACFTFNIIFSQSLRQPTDQTSDIDTLAIVASCLSALSITGTAAVLIIRTRPHHGQVQPEVWRRTITPAAGLLGLISSAATFTTYVWMYRRKEDLPERTIGALSIQVLSAAFICWGLSAISQSAFLLALFLDRRFHSLPRGRQRRPLTINVEEPSTLSPEMASVAQPHRPSTTFLNTTKESAPTSTAPSISDFDSSRTSTFSSSRKRSGSDTLTSLRSSLSHVVRPLSSNTTTNPKVPRLPSLQTTTTTKKRRPTSTDSGTGEREIGTEERKSERENENVSFDDWDTSAVDAQARMTINSSSPPPPTSGFSISTANNSTLSHSQSSQPPLPTPLFPSQHPSSHPPRFLETIPASPTTSRSPSPGFPLDRLEYAHDSSEAPTPTSARLEPPFGGRGDRRRRSRSASPSHHSNSSPLPSPSSGPTSSSGPYSRTRLIGGGMGIGLDTATSSRTSSLTMASASGATTPRAITASRLERTPSPSEGTSFISEAHIHPLFRRDSPTPPPSATPGTVVTAAPGAGLVLGLEERRGLMRMRSGSLPGVRGVGNVGLAGVGGGGGIVGVRGVGSLEELRRGEYAHSFGVSPSSSRSQLFVSASAIGSGSGVEQRTSSPLSPVELDDSDEAEAEAEGGVGVGGVGVGREGGRRRQGRVVGREAELEMEMEAPPPEREMTPPIPEWILGAGQRSSLTGYLGRRRGGGGEGK